MKLLHLSARFIVVCTAVLLPLNALQAAVTTWNAASGLWSTINNWDTLAIPGAADDVRFVDVGAGATNTVDAGFTINSLAFAQDNQALHTMLINPGRTLTVTRTTTGDVMTVNSGAAATTASTQLPVSVIGQGATLSISGTGNLVVRQGNSASGSHMATLDLSALDTFNANVGRLLVGQANAGESVNRPSGTLLLAKTNFITLTGTAPQVMVQDSGQNANGSVVSVLTLGQNNSLFADQMRLGGQKGNGTVNFNPAFSAPKLTLRNTDGASRITTLSCGDNSFASSGNSTVAVIDLSLGLVDAQVDTMYIARGNPGPSTGTCTSTVTLGAGIFDVNTLELAYQVATGTSGAVTGTLNVNNNGLSNTGAVLVVNNTLRLCRLNGSTAAVNGTLNVNGGTVVANSIVAGGGNSSIVLSSGSKLVVTGSAGTLVAPVKSFTLSDSTLTLPASNGGASLAVAALNGGGSQNLINISSIPSISSYPVTFPLITYQTGSGNGTFALGSLPAGSPAYHGTITDSGNGIVQLTLTQGPVVNLNLHWTGAADSSWNSFSYDWTASGHATNFFSGASVVFDDTSSQTNISLDESLSPGNVTVSNSVETFSFTGPGVIAGASSLVKSGTGTLTIDNQGLDVFGTVLINAGTVQVGTANADGSIAAITMTNNGTLAVNDAGNLTLNSAIAGSGSVSKAGVGALVLSGANTYSGATTLSGGTLELDQTSSGTGPVTSTSGTTLTGSGPVNGLVTVGGQLNPGKANGPGTFQAHGGLVLSAGSTVVFDLSATDIGNPAVNDMVEVFGNLTANNTPITVNISGPPPTGASYLLFTYTGTLNGSFNPVVLGSHYQMSLDTTSAGAVYLNVTGSSGANLEWASPADPAWDGITTNWQTLGSKLPSVFLAGDTALLDDAPGVSSTITIPAGVTVYPAAVTNSADSTLFFVNGTGGIGGGASIVKSGQSTWSLGSANSFTGPVDIQAGTLQLDSDSALGTSAGGTTVEPGATLNLNGHNVGGEILTVSGSGVGDQGAIVSTGGTQNQAVRQIVLVGDTTFGGSGLWAMNNGGGAASLSTSGNPYTLTKVGPNQVNLAQLATLDTALGTIDIQQGTIEFSGLTPGMGDPSYTNFVHSGATLSFANTSVVWNKNFDFTGNGSTTTLNIGNGGNTEIAGPIHLTGDCVFNVGGTLLTVSGAISGDGGIVKNGGTPIILSAPNTYTGDTRITAAAMRLSGNGSISNSANVLIYAGATLTVTGRVDATFTLNSGQSLQGNGVVNGSVVAPAGSTISPGLNGIGQLTVSNAVVLGGTTSIDLDPGSGTNDVIRCGGAMTFGGVLNITDLGDPVVSGGSFKLFYASSYTGAFTSIVPAIPGPGLTWDTSALRTSGTLKVSGTPPSPPRIGPARIIGDNLVISGSGGPLSGGYYVLSSTDVTLPPSSWTRIATNNFDASGNFTFTNVISPSVPKRFFMLQLQ